MDPVATVLSALPHSPGVYIYKDERGKVIYVGKAIDLSRRVKSYFQRDAVGDKTQTLVSQIRTIETIQTGSEFDALLLEAKLIKQYLPRYNVIAKDDKSPLYVCFTTGEILPRVVFLRKHEIDTSMRLNTKDKIFGPFQSARVARSLLRNLRHIIPYCTQKKREGRGCFYTHLGLCKPCPSIIAKMEDGTQKNLLQHQYRTNIFRITNILSGQSTAVVRELEKDMQEKAREHRFEEAGEIKQQIDAIHELLTHKYDPVFYLEKATAAGDIHKIETDSLRQLLVPFFPGIGVLHRIECVDMSHLSGTDATGSLVVLTDGIMDKSQYRRFRIRAKDATDDTARMRELLERRFKHNEWEQPDLLIVDGGKAQVSSAQTVLTGYNMSIPLIGLAKREEEIIVQYRDTYKILRLSFTNPALQLVQRIRDEAHRFAKSYQVKLRGKIFSVKKSLIR